MVPAGGFYEWCKQDRSKQPVYVDLANRRLLSMAGIWTPWTNNEGEFVESFAIVTSSPNALMQPIYDRMPVFVAPDQYSRCLDVAKPHPEELLVPYPAHECMHIRSRIESTKREDSTT